MSETISKGKFKNEALAWMRRVQAEGSELVILDRGKPVLRLVPYEQEPSKLIGSLRGSVIRYDAPLEPAAPIEDWDALK